MTTSTDPKESAERAKAWVNSHTGQAKLAQILSLSSTVTVQLARKRKVDPKSLKKPISR